MLSIRSERTLTRAVEIALRYFFVLICVFAINIEITHRHQTISITFFIEVSVCPQVLGIIVVMRAQLVFALPKLAEKNIPRF